MLKENEALYRLIEEYEKHIELDRELIKLAENMGDADTADMTRSSIALLEKKIRKLQSK